MTFDIFKAWTASNGTWPQARAYADARLMHGHGHMLDSRHPYMTARLSHCQSPCATIVYHLLNCGAQCHTRIKRCRTIGVFKRQKARAHGHGAASHFRAHSQWHFKASQIWTHVHTIATLMRQMHGLQLHRKPFLWQHCQEYHTMHSCCGPYP